MFINKGIIKQISFKLIFLEEIKVLFAIKSNFSNFLHYIIPKTEECKVNNRWQIHLKENVPFRTRLQPFSLLFSLEISFVLAVLFYQSLEKS